MRSILSRVVADTRLRRGEPRSPMGSLESRLSGLSDEITRDEMRRADESGPYVSAMSVPGRTWLLHPSSSGRRLVCAAPPSFLCRWAWRWGWSCWRISCAVYTPSHAVC